ncbi:MAG TPA: hypothetical protein PLC22_10060 [Gordonia sp. (in: high G+C Gram-positive bacteria)]|mgnify:FL=1|nr:hypothetical protein [Gordonia sp. (in: high G+C Gram-positive bacteria)]
MPEANEFVVRQTLYYTFRTKSDLLQATYEWAVRDDGPHPHESQWWQAVETADNVRDAVGHLVAGTVPILERAAPLVWVVLSDEDARATYDFNEKLRIDGNQKLIEMLVAKQPLRVGLSLTHARDILLALTGPQQYQLLISEYGWSREDYAEWVTGAVLRELFGVEPDSTETR